MKIVINNSFGGFGLSDAAFEIFLDRKGILWEKRHREDYDWHEYYHAGHLGDDEYYLYSRTMTENRSDPDLVAIVEHFGTKANGDYADLKVVEIPDGVKWHVCEYDGLEHIAEDHRTWR
jgi:hypothetical protein